MSNTVTIEIPLDMAEGMLIGNRRWWEPFMIELERRTKHTRHLKSSIEQLEMEIEERKSALATLRREADGDTL